LTFSHFTLRPSAADLCGGERDPEWLAARRWPWPLGAMVGWFTWFT
jgi:hypothetical protein